MGRGLPPPGEPFQRKRPPGRPRIDHALKRSMLVAVYLSPVEIEKLDALRGQRGRADWLARAAGVRE